jgi:DNA-binding NarL/FixJ family response regulator
VALRIVIVDDHPLFLRATRQVVEEADGMDVVGEARSGTEALSVIARAKPDVVLMDIRMPGMDGLTCLERIRARHPEVKVIVFSATTDTAQIDAALRRGAAAYIVKSVDPLDLPTAIRQAQERTVYQAGEPGPPEAPAADLTKRELVILRAVARGLSNQEISRELWVTEQTVKFHLTNIYRKLGVANRTAAARYAHQHGLVATSVP